MMRLRAQHLTSQVIFDFFLLFDTLEGQKGKSTFSSTIFLIIASAAFFLATLLGNPEPVTETSPTVTLTSKTTGSEPVLTAGL